MGQGRGASDPGHSKVMRAMLRMSSQGALHLFDLQLAIAIRVKFKDDLIDLCVRERGATVRPL